MIPKKKSSRHHYIPQFFLEGFTNPDGLLYIYDKNHDLILKRPRSPKSVFFEKDRNTIYLRDSIESSIIEDDFYSKVDDNLSKIIRRFQQEQLSKLDFTVEDTAHFLFFLITLFWRIPKTDFAAEDLIDRSVIASQGIDPETLRNDPTFRKTKRVDVFKHHVDQIINHGKKGNRYINIHQSNKEIYIIGDYPLLFRKTPTLFCEFNDIDFLIAISSNRIYSSTLERLENLTDFNSFMYNAAIINQSVRYVGCSNIETLQKSLVFYKGLKSHGLENTIVEKTFVTNK